MSNEKDPWGGGGKKPDGPPDLDAALKKFQNQLKAAFGGKKSGDGSTGGGIGIGIGLIVGLILLIWALSGIFIVSPAEQSVILQWGKYKETLGPGIHWIPRFIDSNYTVNVQQISTYPYESEMLTKDENIVSVELAVQYRINNPRDYLFKITNAIASLRQATASALRQIVGQTTLDDILTTGRAKVSADVTKQLKKILDRYHSGILITDVTLQPAKPPEPVTAAFDDAIKAREDEQRYINKAEAYAQQVVPVAQGKAARILQEANAYQQQVVLGAKAHIAGYLALLPEYKKSPNVTRERLYLNAMQSVLTKSSKVLVDVKGSHNMLYLPLDKLMKRDRSRDLSTGESDDEKADHKTESPSRDTTGSTQISSYRPSYPTRLPAEREK